MTAYCHTASQMSPMLFIEDRLVELHAGHVRQPMRRSDDRDSIETRVKLSGSI